jgi:desampylase
MIEIPGPVIGELFEEAQWIAPREHCGLLAGEARLFDDTGQEHVVVSRFVPVTNAADDEGEFAMDHVQQRLAIADIENADELVVGIFHSHPRGDARPSRADGRTAYPDLHHVIAGLLVGLSLRAWVFRSGAPLEQRITVARP